MRLRSRKSKAIREALNYLYRGPESVTPVIINGKISSLLPVGDVQLGVRYDAAPRSMFPAALYLGTLV